MVLVKIKPLGWVIVLLAFAFAGVAGFILSRTSTAGAAESMVGSASQPPQAFSKKVPLEHISATDAAVKNPMPADDLDTAEKNIDKPVTFVGRVSTVYVPGSNSVQIINFAENYKDAVSAAIDAPDYGKFPDPKTLEGKDLLITGQMIIFNKHLEVKLTSPDQIKIVDGMANPKGSATKTELIK